MLAITSFPFTLPKQSFGEAIIAAMKSKEMGESVEAYRLDESPQGSDVIHFVAPGKSHATDGMLLAAKSTAGADWVGLFSRGDSNYVSFGLLLPQTLIAVSYGAAYIVPVNKPSEYFALPHSSCTFLHVMRDATAAILVSAESIECVTADGITWTCEPDADGIEFVSESADRIEVVASMIGNGDRRIAISSVDGAIIER